MQIYNYDPQTLLFTEISEADPNPLEPGQYIIPAYATTEKPLTAKKSYWVKFIDGQWEYEAIPPPPPPPPPPEPVPPTAEENKMNAQGLLSATDWTTIPDVADPIKSNPYLSNVNDFLTYRNTVRRIAINPPSGFIEWAKKPNAVWTYIEPGA
jgi:hypothetical protein